MQISPQRYRHFAAFALLCVAAIIVTGAAVRVTGSGLGCPTWPNCEKGSLVPTGASDGHAVIEFVNRVFTGLIAIATIGAVLAAWYRTPKRTDLLKWSALVAAFIPVQAIVGGITVKVKLNPAAVATHFLLSIPIAGAALVLWRRAGFDRSEDVERARTSLTGPTKPGTVVLLSRAIVAFTFLVLVAGTGVTGTGPHGGDPDVKRFGFSALAAVRVHGVLVWMLLLLVVIFAIVTRSEGNPSLRTGITRLLALILVQGAVGYLQWWNGIPAGLVLLHVATAVVVWLAAVDLAWRIHFNVAPRSTAASAAPKHPNP